MSASDETRMKIWHLDDGADHWVFATDEEDAMLVLCEQYGDDMRESWARWGAPDACCLSVEQAMSVTIHDDEGRNPTPLSDIFASNPSRAYVACSEW